jgi:hypothetical protein
VRGLEAQLQGLQQVGAVTAAHLGQAQRGQAGPGVATRRAARQPLQQHGQAIGLLVAHLGAQQAVAGVVRVVTAA